MDRIQPQRQSVRKLGAIILPPAAALAALWYVLHGYAWQDFARTAFHLDWRWIVAAVFADIASYLFQGVRWSILLNVGGAVAGLLRTTRAIYAGLFVNEVLPLRPGEVLRGWIISRETGKPARAIVPSMVAERTMDAAVLVGAAVATAIFLPLPRTIEQFVQVGGSGLAIAGVWIALARIPAAWKEPLQNMRAMAVSVLPLLGQCLAVWCILRACELPLSFLAACGITIILRVGTALPLAPANIGTHQLAMLAGLALFGITGTQAVSSAMIVFAVLTLPLLVLGALAFAVSGVPLKSLTHRPAGTT